MPADPVVSPADTPAATCPGCGRPVSECRAEDADESYPAVSPADTIRRTVEDIPHSHGFDFDPTKPCLRCNLEADLRALLAVGERDKAEIAGLTEGLERLGHRIASFNEDESDPALTWLAEDVAAVLAGEEDARP